MQFAAHVYRIAPRLQRCCWYLLFGSVLFAWATVRFGELAGHSKNENAIVAVTFGLLGTLALIPLAWRLTIDSSGVSSHLGFVKETWQWDDLASGRVEKKLPRSFRDPQRPWRTRTLRLTCLEACDYQEAIAIINRHYRLPPAPPTPSELTIRYAWKRTAVMHQRGIILHQWNGLSRQYGWHAVRQVLFTRSDLKRRDFLRLQMELPGADLVLLTHQGEPTWRGGSSEVISEFILRNCPEKVATHIQGTPPNGRRQTEASLAAAQKLRREISCVSAAGFVLGSVVTVWTAAVDGLFTATLQGCLMIVMPGLPLLFTQLSSRSKIQQLTQQLANPGT